MKKCKKILSVILMASIIFSNAQLIISYANDNRDENIGDNVSTQIEKEDNYETVDRAADVTAPVLDVNSLKIDKRDPKIGDTIKISAKVTDDMSGIKSVTAYYKAPITGKSKYIYMDYNENSGLYEGELKIDDTIESGVWQIDMIQIKDNVDNESIIHNSNINDYGSIREDLSEGNFSVSETTTDVTAPVLDIDSLKVDKKESKPGDTVKISAKVTDDMSGIKNVTAYYKTPITGKYKYIYMDYNENSGLYEGELKIDDTIESGVWQIDMIQIKDNVDNESIIHNSNINNYGSIREDLSEGNFSVSETTTDVKAPVLDVDSLKVDKKENKLGDTVKISVKVTDDISGIKSVTAYYEAPITGKHKYIYMDYNKNSGLYEGKLKIDDTIESGVWQIDMIQIMDNVDNESIIHNSNINNYGAIREDLSSGDFLVSNDDNPIKPISNSTVLTENDTWINKTINGDLYVGPNAILTINGNVKVNGNIYVLGALKSYGGLTVTGTLKGKSMSWGGSPTLYNGTIVMYGSNSISSTIMTNYPIDDIPVRIDTKPLIANNGKLSIKGATIDIADIYIGDKKIKLDYKGRFDINDVYIGNKDSFTIEFRTVFGNTIKKTIKLDNHINKAPEIISKNITIKIGDAFDPMTYVSASDKEDGDITANIIVKENTVDTSKLGIYKVVYEVSDSDKNTVTKEIKVTVRSNEKPSIIANDITLKVGNQFNGLSGVTANDKEDGNITSKIIVKENAVDIYKPGTYKVVYEVSDSDKNTVSKEIKVTVHSVTDKNADYYDHWAKDSIQYAMDSGWVLTTNVFRPEDDITRCEFVKIVNKAFNHTRVVNEPFIDVTPNDWFYDEVRKGIAAGYLSTGYEKFRPFDKITRQEAAKIIGSIMDIKGDGVVAFKDKDRIDSWALEYVDGLNERGIIKGNNGYFAPHDNLTRSEGVTILERAIK